MKVLKHLFYFLMSPLMNTDAPTLSLGRILMFLYTSGLLHMLFVHAPILVAMGPCPATLLTLVFMVLACYCFGDKPWVRELLLDLVSRLPMYSRATLIEGEPLKMSVGQFVAPLEPLNPVEDDGEQK